MTTTPHLVKPGTQVNTTDGSTAQFDSEITPLQDGGYVVVWTDLSLTYNPQGSAIVGQRYNSAGNKIGGDPAHGGEVFLSLFPNGNQSRPAVTTLANGDIAVAYADLFFGNSDITVHIFDPSLHFVRTDLIEDGLAQTFDPSLTALADGSYVVSYTLGTGTNTEVVARTVSAAGMMGAQFNLEHHPVGSATLPQSFSHLATLSNGNAVAVYTDTFSGADTDIKFTILTPAGSPVKEGLGVTGATTSLAENGADVAALHGGGFVVTWTEPATGGTDIHATIMSNDGLPIAFGLLVNTTTPRNQSASDVVALDDGGFLVTWEDVVAGTRGQRFDALGHQIGAEFTLDTGTQTGHRDAAVLDDGRIAFALDHVSIDFDVTTSIFTDDTPLDFNANGLSDILWQNDNGAPALWLMNGLTVVSNSPAGPFNPGPSWHVKDSGDFNGDGHADILWQSDDGMPAIWLMNGSNALSNGAAGSFNPGPDWQIKASGDFNGDGKSDILWQGSDGTPAIWLMDGLTVLSNSPAGSFNPGPSWQIKDTGDFNGDGKSDILWQNDDGTAAIWLMNGSTVLVQQRRRSVQSGAHVAHQGHRRLQRRRQVRHSVAGPGRHRGGLADGRHHRHVCRCRRLQSGTDLGDQGHRRLQRRRQVRHPVAGPGRHACHLDDGRHSCLVGGCCRLVQSWGGLARDHLRRLHRCVVTTSVRVRCLPMRQPRKRSECRRLPPHHVVRWT